MALVDALAEWLELLRAAGVPMHDVLGPVAGAAAAEAMVDGDVHDDLVTWFTTVGPTTSAYERFSLPPTGRHPLSLEESHGIRRALVAHRSDEFWFEEYWIPILHARNDDLAIDSRDGTVWRATNEPLTDDLLGHHQVADRLEDLVGVWLDWADRLKLTWHPDNGTLEYDYNDPAPAELLARGVLG